MKIPAPWRVHSSGLTLVDSDCACSLTLSTEVLEIFFFKDLSLSSYKGKTLPLLSIITHSSLLVTKQMGVFPILSNSAIPAGCPTMSLNITIPARFMVFIIII